MPKLIEAFTNVYGAKHHEYLAYTLNNLSYTYFLSETYINLFLDFHGHNVKPQDKKILGYYRRYLNHLDNLYATTKEDIDTFLVKHYLVATDLDSDWLTDANFLNALRCDTPLFNDLLFMENASSNYQTIKSILLPIFTINMEILVHELNHAIARRHYFFISDTLEYPKLFKPEDDSEDIISEELFNDYIARKVIEEFLRIGGIIPPALSRFKFSNQYKCNDFLIISFYQKFHKLLLEAYISGNYNQLNIIGKSDFDAYCTLITQMYYEEDITEKDLAELEEKVDIMANNYHDFASKR